ncbi:Uricase [Pirellulimonas nuda]|uniref:Uricase n=1 Tax=Pirellulimonas nuda TaxID=2528009 RepID=A0A518DGZ4_9BACT|nr:urate oxidase [Pirellulimonas nuda]QDU90745.1 Uricase [Pirellulimonas nuda]
MPHQLAHHAYGKHRVRVSKIKRPRRGAASTERHELIEAAVDIELEGGFAPAYTDGDNASIVATDTCKNTVYALAKDDPFDTIESFGRTLAEHFVSTYDHITRAGVTLHQHSWARLLDCPHAFTGSDAETPTARVVAQRGAPTRVEAGVTGLMIAKTTESGFSGFHRDAFRTLPDTDDRIFATELTASWVYADQEVDFVASRSAIRKAMLARFIDHYSESVQQTLWLMGQAALDACDAATSITLTMPNKHHLLFNLAPLGRENDNEVFVSTDEPFGWITGTVTR